ncbi:hypothetical protein MRA01_58930 [Methylobacterium radiotolerans]|jgi:transcriptional regulator with XRE-family HTH domain|nr:hypothetical protein MRA01_58930 [Methylobacterium radiotolerans]
MFRRLGAKGRRDRLSAVFQLPDCWVVEARLRGRTADTGLPSRDAPGMSKDGSNPLGWIEAEDLRARQAGPLDRDIGERIRKHRQDRRLGYGQLGGMLGFSGQQMRKYERGLSRIPASTLYVIAHILDVPVNYLLPDEKRMLNPIQQRIQEITTKLSYIEDVRFLVAVSIFISAAANYSQTGRLR